MKVDNFKNASQRIVSLADLYDKLNKIADGFTFSADLDPFNYGKSECGFTFDKPHSPARTGDFAILLQNAGIKFKLIADRYVFIEPESVEIAKKIFSNYTQGKNMVVNPALENLWRQTINSK